MRQITMYVMFGITAVAMFVIATSLYGWSQPWLYAVALVPLVVSIYGMLAVRAVVEETLPNGMYNPKTQSWAFLFGDSLVLPAAMLFIALGREGSVLPAFADSGKWLFAAGLIGLVLGNGFHMWEVDSYRKQDAMDALDAPTKIWHDYVVYPVLVGTIVWAGVPLLVADWQGLWVFFGPWTWLALASIGIWFALGALDGKRGLRVYNMHPAWDKTHFRVRQPE